MITLHPCGLWRVQLGTVIRWTDSLALANMWLVLWLLDN